MNLRQRGQLPPISADALLIWPSAGNSGDRLIADACERFLLDHGIEAWRSDGSIEDAAIAGDTEYLGDFLACFRGMVMFSGGGNIGIYPDNAQIRSAVIARISSRHRCLVFPQSVMKPESALVDPRVTVWCRDAASEAILQDAGVRTGLVPDAALYMDDVIPKRPDGKGLFYIRRTRGGDAETIEHRIEPECPAFDLTLSNSLDQILAMLEPYEIVISDRLHGGLIAAMMRKKVVLLPVGYHKIQSFYDTWQKCMPGIAYVSSQEELSSKLSALQAPTADLHDLFCAHAEPAFNRFLLGA
jgi:exopolysaccharide biosynthesis predicted pyruvyltransferase EpsI